jgi:tRNA dimethylallyltransferase
VGKTALAVELAEALGGEIIGADSRQIYRHMDIGTAKPTSAQRRRVPHHLLDVVDPDGALTLAEYQKLAYAAVAEIHQRGRVPLLVGGTGQYISAVIEGWSVPEVPPNPALRTELEGFAAQHGAEALHQRLRALDPTAAARIDARNVRRVIRALEVYLEAGKPISALQTKHPPLLRIVRYGLTLERAALYARADERVRAMMAAGLLDEVRKLLDMGYSRALPAMSGLGYRQLAAHVLDGVPLAEAVAQTQHATHDFIRRQYTWFRGHDASIIWFDASGLNTAVITDMAARWLQEWG